MTEQPQDLVTFLWVSLLAVGSVCGTLAVLYKQATARIHAMHEAALKKEEDARAHDGKAAKERELAAEAAEKELREALAANTEALNRIARRLPRKGGNHDNGG